MASYLMTKIVMYTTINDIKQAKYSDTYKISSIISFHVDDDFKDDFRANIVYV